MPERPSQEFSWQCPSCGRRVPRTISTCRCGASVPAGPDIADIDTTAPARGATSLVIGAALALALGGAAYWMLGTPASTSATASASGVPAAPPPPADSAPAAEVSAEARAWNASATASNPSPTVTSTPARETATPVPTATPPAVAGNGSIEDMVDRVMPAVVLIETTSGRGSGFFISNDTLITNVHVVQNDAYVTLRRMDGSAMNARVADKAPAFDIAVLKVAQPAPSQVFIPMSSAQSLKPGQEIIVIGSALGTLQNSVSRGIVSGLRTSGGATLVQTDAAVNPGNSGGPMLDRNGSVIGITTMGYTGAEGLNFGVAIDHARDIVEGRQVNLGSQRGLAEIQAQSAASQSESDRQQSIGQQELQGRLGQLVDAARTIDGGWKQYREQCYQSPLPGSYDRGWFVMLVPGGMPANAGAGCPSFYSTMDADVKQFRDLMRRTIDDARRANVLPGTIRDVLKTNRLDFEWQR